MTWKEIKDKIESLGVKDEDLVYIRFKLESDSLSADTNTIIELCVSPKAQMFPIQIILTEKY